MRLPKWLQRRFCRFLVKKGGSERPQGQTKALHLHHVLGNEGEIQSKLLQTDKMAALGQLVSGIAHELNNPLTSIMGYAQLLLARDSREAANSEAKLIFDEAERARGIVKNLLFFARQARPERVRTDLNEIISRTLALRGYELRVENISVKPDLWPDLPPILADPQQLQQVVLNLLVNAEQAILEGQGQGEIEVRSRIISDARIALDISDDGPGIPAGIRSRIFDPFFTTKRPGVGTGLGLSIVYGIVEQHGGEVSFENLRPRGARFTVELPIMRAIERRDLTVPSRPAAGAIYMGSGRILVVEDEPTVARLVCDVLREEGYEVDALLDSYDALDRVSRIEYDLLICDLRMPRLDGPAFYDALERTGNGAQDRILFITGDTLGSRTFEFLKSHRLPYLAKPFLVEELKLAVSKAMKSGKRSSAAVLDIRRR